MTECMMCCRDITTKESEEYNNHCNECHILLLIKSIAFELRAANITFEELTRKIIEEVDR